MNLFISFTTLLDSEILSAIGIKIINPIIIGHSAMKGIGSKTYLLNLNTFCCFLVYILNRSSGSRYKCNTIMNGIMARIIYPIIK